MAFSTKVERKHKKRMVGWPDQLGGSAPPTNGAVDPSIASVWIGPEVGVKATAGC